MVVQAEREMLLMNMNVQGTLFEIERVVKLQILLELQKSHDALIVWQQWR
jgi:hypothetical protein